MGKIKRQTDTYEESDTQAAESGSRPIPRPGIGHRISAVAKRIGTRKSAASIAGVSGDSLQRYIRDENMPPFDVVARLCVEAGVRMEWLATGDEPMLASEAASGQASQPLRRDDLMMALQLATEALGDRFLPPEKHAELVTLIYELLEEGLPEAKVLRFARAASA